MKFRTLMIIKAIVCLTLGVPILLAPVLFYSVFGASIGPGGAFVAREYGAALLGNLLVTWIARNAAESDARRGIIWGLFVYDAIGVVITLAAVLSGVLGPLGWFAVAIYLFFTVGYGYFLAKSPQLTTRRAV